jgi:pSer/pThr/pTyr-binding forkhead associated (FHA) protein
VPESLLAILKLCALALLYLFFFRVIRAVWAEVRTPAVVAAPAPAQAPARRPARPEGRSSAKLTVVEPPALAGRTYGLGQELTVGRAAGCQITLDDGYVSQLHARIFARDEAFYVEDLGSTNGTFLNSEKVTAPVAMRRGDRLRIGSTVMELSG